MFKINFILSTGNNQPFKGKSVPMAQVGTGAVIQNLEDVDVILSKSMKESRDRIGNGWLAHWSE